MRFEWLNIKNNNELIVFFNGWGFDKNVVSALDCSNFDVLMFYDYTTFEPMNFDFTDYNKKHLIAWSLGVYVCNFYFNDFVNFNSFSAINGTLKPIDDIYGIPKTAYNLTIDNFNELTCRKFERKINAPFQITRNISDLKQELINIKNLECKNFLNFKKAIISKKDRIFPYNNMLRFWNENNTKIIELDAPHYIFDNFKFWGDLI